VVDRGEPRSETAPTWRAGWEDQEGNTLEASMAATPLQRLEWLEEAIELAWETGALGPRGQGTASTRRLP
jgi:hypothetical protein